MSSKFLICSALFEICLCGKMFSQDHFAEIGTRQYNTRKELLVVPSMFTLPQKYLPGDNNVSARFEKEKTDNTNKSLLKKVDELRAYYEPFLENMASEIVSKRERIPLETFDWRIEKLEDRRDFSSVLDGKGEWTEVKIPHFGPPLGRAVTYYRKEINIPETKINGRELFICFKGVDYKATVYFNDVMVGKHEGVFAPFEYNVSQHTVVGKNVILVKVENDYSMLGSSDGKVKAVGDKVYAATGLGYDDHEIGWHHCPPGMGIYQDCFLEFRNPVHINDIFVRPVLKDSIAEAWIEVNNFFNDEKPVSLSLSVYGQNFNDTVVENFEYIPYTVQVPGVGDLAKPTDWQKNMLKMGYGPNLMKIPLKINNIRIWEQVKPWLYQLQVKVLDENGKVLDTKKQHFGMRSFTMDTVNIPRGRMFLNDKMIRLRGANTMGAFQQCVMKKDWNRLIDDILLAKICNMNYIRFTQLPVQPEIYDYCDKLGMLVQTDLPLFGSVRWNQFAEIIRQGGEMERLIRSHPSCVLVTYMNERFPNAEGHPQRSIDNWQDFYKLFTALDQIVLYNNPDRVIKSADGDYDPPSPGLPDTHCYNIWYNGHGLGLGEMYKGQWQYVKPGWYYGCGEFGAEGLDPINVMKKYYPSSWLPSDRKENEKWTPTSISQSQLNRFHYMWFNTPKGVEDWISKSQDYQAEAVKLVTESFRRDSRMVSFAVHLFIDAWPAGWMKSIMDVDRQPKKAYFAYRHALEPLMASIRSDRNKFYSGEKTNFEIWICNDLNYSPDDYILKYQVEKNGKVIFSNQNKADIKDNTSVFQGYVDYKVPIVRKRTEYTLRISLTYGSGNSVYQNSFDFEVFPEAEKINAKVYLADRNGVAESIINESGVMTVSDLNKADVIVIDNFETYRNSSDKWDAMVSEGKKLIFFELNDGEYSIADTDIRVRKTEMGDYYFVSPLNSHGMCRNFEPNDFRFWYNRDTKTIRPIVSYTVEAPQWQCILSSGLTNWISKGDKVHVAGELRYGNGSYRFCELQLQHRLKDNPTAYIFLKNLIDN